MRLNISQPSLSRLERGIQPLNDTVTGKLRDLVPGALKDAAAKLVEAAKTRSEQSLEPLDQSIQQLLAGKHGLRSEAGGPDIPYFSDIAAGIGEDQDQRSAPRDHVMVPPDIYHRDPGCYALRVVGDSMSPLIREGDIIVISPKASLIDGCIVAAYVEPDGDIVKQYFTSATGGVLLRSINPSYEDIRLELCEGRAARIWGRVVFQQREL